MVGLRELRESLAGVTPLALERLGGLPPFLDGFRRLVGLAQLGRLFH